MIEKILHQPLQSLGMTGEIDPTDDVDETPVKVLLDKSIKFLLVPT